MIRVVAIIVVTTYLSMGAAADEPLLTQGSPAPKLEGAVFLRGPALAGLSPGTVHVIEFSGTECAPCRKAIPHLEELQRTHREMIFLSVFSEPADRVRRYLEGPGKGITIRVVCDPDQNLTEAWSVAAGQFGIPHVFVVDGAGKIAWIGHPEELDEPLARVVAGKPMDAVDPLEGMRRRLQKREHQVRQRLSERELKAREESQEPVTALIQRGELEQAVRTLDHLIATYHDLPSVEAYRARKLFVLGLMPGRREEAFSLAFEIAVDARVKGSPSVDAAANTIMNHHERCLPDNRDARMLHLALTILGDAAVPGEDSVTSLSSRSGPFLARSRAYGLQGNQAAAAAALRQAITAEEKLLDRLRAEKFPDENLNDQKARIARLVEQLAGYSRK